MSDTVEQRPLDRPVIGQNDLQREEWIERFGTRMARKAMMPIEECRHFALTMLDEVLDGDLSESPEHACDYELDQWREENDL